MRAPANALDPQDVGLGVSAGWFRHGVMALSVPTCGLSDWKHGVWSPGGPRRGQLGGRLIPRL
jgi:hypothetical protein